MAAIRSVSDVINDIVGGSWLQPPKLSLSREIDIDLRPVLQVQRGSPGDVLPPPEFDRIMAECGIPPRDEFDKNFLSERERLDNSPQKSSSPFKYMDDAMGMTILSSISKAFPPTSDTIINNSDLPAVVERLANVRSVEVSNDIEDTDGVCALAKELINLTSCDKWLRQRIHTNDFDGTWISIICGLYQSLYLYQTEFVEEHCQSSQHFNAVLSKGKVMVLLLRQQHLEEFQYIVTERLLKLSTACEKRNHILEILGNKDFIVESLFASVYQIREKMGRWAEGCHTEFGFHADTQSRKKYTAFDLFEYDLGFSKFSLANIFERMMVCALQDDKWLWKYLMKVHVWISLDVIFALYQALYLYSGIDKSNKEMIESNDILNMEDGRLVVLLFRLKHLEVFSDKLKRVWLGLGEDFLDASVQGCLQKSLIETMKMIILCTRIRSLCCALDSKNSENHDLDNVFFGSSMLSNDLKVEDLIDLNHVHTLGGLVCTIEGGLGNNEGKKCTSWCIIRVKHEFTSFYFCVDLKDDEFLNKQRMLDGTIDVDFDGIVEVATVNAITSVKSLEHDGSYFYGSIDDFADMKGQKNSGESCAAAALHTLTKKPFLGDYNLKCSTLYMMAMAFLVGNKNHLKLAWRGTAGHVEFLGRASLDQSLRESTSTLQKCTLLYTSSSTRVLGQDIIWKGDDGAHSSRDVGESMRLKTEGHIDKVKIILGHQNLWKYHKCLEVDFCKDHVEEILTKTPNKQVKADEVAALAALKRNTGGGVGVLTVKVQANHEYRPLIAEKCLKESLLGLEAINNYHDMIVYGHLDLFSEKFCTLQVELENGSIGNNEQEIFVVRTDHSRCLQIFACNERAWPGYEDSTYYDFTWITDFVAKDLDAAERIMKCTLKGKEVKIQRTGPTLKMEPRIDEFKTSSMIKLIDKFKQKLQKYEDIVIKDETMVHGSKIQWKKIRESSDGWQFIIGKQKDYAGKNYFFHATEVQAVVCSAAYYTTGGAILRTEIESAQNSDQPSTSSSVIASSGCCRILCKASRFLTNERKVTATGRFSTCKSQDVKLQKKFYWG